MSVSKVKRKYFNLLILFIKTLAKINISAPNITDRPTVATECYNHCATQKSIRAMIKSTYGSFIHKQLLKAKGRSKGSIVSLSLTFLEAKCQLTLKLKLSRR